MSAWSFAGHVDPPPVEELTAVVGPAFEEETTTRVGLIFYLGPNHYPAGLYMPQGYDLEERPGDDEDWKVLRARDSQSRQVLTTWAVRTDSETEGERVKILDP